MSLSRTGAARLLFLALALYVLYQSVSVLLPVLLALILAFFLHPVVDCVCGFFSRREFHLPRSLVVIAVMLVTITLFAGIMSFIFFPFVTEFNKFILNLPAILSQLQNMSLVIGEKASAIDLPSNVRSILDQGLSSITSYSIDFVKHIVAAVFGVATRAIALVVIPVLVYYFLKDGAVMQQEVVKCFSPVHQRTVQTILGEAAVTVSAYLRGQLLISVIMGCTVFFGLFILGVDYPLVIALLAFLTETIPIIGPIIGAIPALVLAYLISPALAFKVMIFYIIVHQIDSHIIVPSIMGHTIALHPAVVIISVLIAGQMFGIVGMMLAVPTVALLRILIRHLHIVG